MARNSPQFRFTYGLIGVAVASLVGCAAPLTAPSEPEATSQGRTTGTYASLAALDISAIANIVMVDNVTLGSTSDAVVVGTLRDWLVGDKVTTDGGADVGAAILAEVEVDTVVTLADGVTLAPGDIIYLTMIAPTMDTEQLVESLPEDLRMAAYLDGPLSPEALAVDESLEVQKTESAATGEPRWVPEAQGLVVVDPDDSSSLIWPMLGTRFEGMLDDALPGGTLDGR